MASETVRRTERWGWLAPALVCQLVLTAMELWWPGSPARTPVRIVWYACITIWLGLKIREGYRRRRPHWTRESWLRYIRLAVMPVLALTIVLYVSSFDFSLNTLGAPGSPTRSVVATTLLAMMILGVIGVFRAFDWIEKGEASEQFTRTRWFQRRRGAPAK